MVKNLALYLELYMESGLGFFLNRVGLLDVSFDSSNCGKLEGLFLDDFMRAKHFTISVSQ